MQKRGRDEDDAEAPRTPRTRAQSLSGASDYYLERSDNDEDAVIPAVIPAEFVALYSGESDDDEDEGSQEELIVRDSVLGELDGLVRSSIWYGISEDLIGALARECFQLCLDEIGTVQNLDVRITNHAEDLRFHLRGLNDVLQSRIDHLYEGRSRMYDSSVLRYFTVLFLRRKLRRDTWRESTRRRDGSDEDGIILDIMSRINIDMENIIRDGLGVPVGTGGPEVDDVLWRWVQNEYERWVNRSGRNSVGGYDHRHDPMGWHYHDGTSDGEMQGVAGGDLEMVAVPPTQSNLSINTEQLQEELRTEVYRVLDDWESTRPRTQEDVDTVIGRHGFLLRMRCYNVYTAVGRDLNQYYDVVRPVLDEIEQEMDGRSRSIFDALEWIEDEVFEIGHMDVEDEDEE